MKIFAIQTDITWENKAANFARIQSLLEKAAPEPGSLVALPEMFATGFSMNTGAIAEAYGGETEQFLATSAKQFGIFLLGGAAMKGRDDQVRNKALLFSPEAACRAAMRFMIIACRSVFPCCCQICKARP